MADTTVVASVLTWLETHTSLVNSAGDQLAVMLEDYPAGDGVMFSTLVGEPYVRRYKSGGAVVAFPFAVYLRASALDTAARIDAMRVLGDLAESIDDKDSWPAAPAGFTWDALSIRTRPARVATGQVGPDDYQVTFTLTYRKEG